MGRGRRVSPFIPTLILDAESEKEDGILYPHPSQIQVPEPVAIEYRPLGRVGRGLKVRMKDH